jgi:hypothetical protein
MLFPDSAETLFWKDRCNVSAFAGAPTELPEADEDPQEILDTVKDTIRDWLCHKKKEFAV